MSKESRLVAATSYIEAGHMLLPQEAPWLAEFEKELLAFPGGKHDDQVDSVSQYFEWVRERGNVQLSVSGLYDFRASDDAPRSLTDVLYDLPRW